jgi:hypothetical protein
VQLAVEHRGAAVDVLELTSSPSRRRAVARLLAGHPAAGGLEVPAVEARLGVVLAAAAVALDRQGAAAWDAADVRAIVRARVPEALQLVYRTDRGVWSEARGAEIHRGEFVSFTPDWLLAACAAAINAPQGDRGANRPALLKAIRAELEVLWSDELERLPDAPGVSLNAETAAARRFRESMVRLWTATRTWEVVKAAGGGAGGEVAPRTSLVGRVRSQAAARPPAGKGAGRPRWREIRHALAAWWRPCVRHGGGPGLLLGMRWELVGQVGVELPGVTDQPSLTELGRRYGVLDPSPPAPPVLSGGTDRIAVLTPDLTRELLDDPAAWEEGPELSDTPPPPVTGKLSDTPSEVSLAEGAG